MLSYSRWLARSLSVIVAAVALSLAAAAYWQQRIQQGNETIFQPVARIEQAKQILQQIRRTPWHKEFVEQYGEAPDLSTTDYDYLAAWRAGIRPQRDPFDQNRYHWSSSTPDGKMLKSEGHKTAWKEYFMRETGKNPDALGIATEDDAVRLLGRPLR